jgi:hypothetical protein
MALDLTNCLHSLISSLHTYAPCFSPRARKEVDGKEVEEAVAYEYWEDWAQLRVLEAEVENLQQLLEEGRQRK